MKFIFKYVDFVAAFLIRFKVQFSFDFSLFLFLTIIQHEDDIVYFKFYKKQQKERKKERCTY